MKKYELTDETIEHNGVTLHRIRALKDVNVFVKAGDFGGFVEHERNLRQQGECWVAYQAMVYGDACVTGDALVFGHSKCYGKAIISGYSRVKDETEVFGSAQVYDNAVVMGNAKIFGWASLSGKSVAEGYSEMSIDPLYITGLTPDFDIVVCDKFITAGCQQRTIEGWEDAGGLREDLSSREFKLYKTYWPAVRRLAKLHQRKAEKARKNYGRVSYTGNN